MCGVHQECGPQLFSIADAYVEQAAALARERRYAEARKALEGAQWIFSFVAAPQDAWSNNVAAIAPEATLVHVQGRPPDDSTFAGHVSQWIGEQQDFSQRRR